MACIQRLLIYKNTVRSACYIEKDETTSNGGKELDSISSACKITFYGGNQQYFCENEM